MKSSGKVRIAVLSLIMFAVPGILFGQDNCEQKAELKKQTKELFDVEILHHLSPPIIIKGGSFTMEVDSPLQEGTNPTQSNPGGKRPKLYSRKGTACAARVIIVNDLTGAVDSRIISDTNGKAGMTIKIWFQSFTLDGNNVPTYNKLESEPNVIIESTGKQIAIQSEEFGKEITSHPIRKNNYKLERTKDGKKFRFGKIEVLGLDGKLIYVNPPLQNGDEVRIAVWEHFHSER